MDGAKQEYEKLVGKGHNAASIKKHFEGLAKQMYTDKKHERQFLRTLTPQQKIIYSRARREGATLRQRFHQLPHISPMHKRKLLKQYGVES
jgi:hypothetical protein